MKRAEHQRGLKGKLLAGSIVAGLMATTAAQALPLCSGKTPPGNTDWQLYTPLPNTIFVDIDTTDCNFRGLQAPIFVTSLGGRSNLHLQTTGASSVHNATSDGFRVYIQYLGADLVVDPELANKNDWHINWFGIREISGFVPPEQ